MTVNQEAMKEDAVCNRIVVESDKQGVVDDSAASKTIECLRARLLAERTASKTARRQAQEISEKVKDLHIQLESEIKQRKEAEAALRRLYSVLKEKGIDLGGNVPDDPMDLQAVSNQIVLTGSENQLAEVKESTEVVASPTLEKGHGRMTDGGDGLYGNNAPVDTHSEIHEAEPVDKDQNGDKHKHCSSAKARDTEKGKIQSDWTENDCIKSEWNMQQGHNSDVTSKFKAMLLQIGERIDALSKEQPLSFQLQDLADHVGRMLDIGQDTALICDPKKCYHGCLSTRPDNNCLKGMDTALKAEGFMGRNVPDKGPCIDAVHSIDLTNDIDQTSGQRREELVNTVFPVANTCTQQPRRYDPSGTMFCTPARKDMSVHPNMSPYIHSSVQLPIRDPHIRPCAIQLSKSREPWPSSSIIQSPTVSPYTCTFSASNCIGQDYPCPTEVLNPNACDAKVYDMHPYDEFWSVGRGSGFQREIPPITDHYKMLLRRYFPEGTFSHAHPSGFEDRSSNHELQLHCQGAYPFSQRDLGGENERGHLPSHNGSLSGLDCRNEVAADFNMAFEGKRHYTQEKGSLNATCPAIIHASVPKFFDQNVNGIKQQLPTSGLYDLRMAQPHRYYSPNDDDDDTHPGLHYQSNSLPTSIIPPLDGYSQQSQGMVHLGNGITLYTD
ncbi:hypothetical protein KP509_35G066000 [Ceratopteris richardii]|uniref:Uncharacterized protein n=1 Tax=Ceratopteris richardii TaxID=49495 RepID=A0A8T2QH60_CERRI|nr:hypothetical protein KP509_35G066000 [Ceratopteris richardii]KAH7283203.1 hypothetical protein KP509_35G066000 [Ceratopteris richardii]KAH7283204.1 hypothetical protein KP509_35G066000 [Ceratopteris richardii]KAH7283206.1 hypothetical protein KP509_35G066000 [Ceratopteris richardii]KAH7283207.1 hypothetical protein KP509_35G066000 [Ceratopteris richardii]